VFWEPSRQNGWKLHRRTLTERVGFSACPWGRPERRLRYCDAELQQAGCIRGRSHVALAQVAFLRAHEHPVRALGPYEFVLTSPQYGNSRTTVQYGAASALWECPNNNPFGNRQREQSWGHSTQKPVECMRRPVANNSRPGQLVYDPFLGSGTSLIAAEMTGRVCCGLEISPSYVDVILRRWQAFTGRTAMHQASGQSFDERAGARPQLR
jgi:hypothetical protein